MPIRNGTVKEHTFLRPMLADAYFPRHLVAKGQDLLAQLAARIRREAPEGEAVYGFAQATAKASNTLQDAFREAGSKIETVAREATGGDVDFIRKACGCEVDIEKAIGNRDW